MSRDYSRNAIEILVIAIYVTFDEAKIIATHLGMLTYVHTDLSFAVVEILIFILTLNELSITFNIWLSIPAPFVVVVLPSLENSWQCVKRGYCRSDQDLVMLTDCRIKPPEILFFSIDHHHASYFVKRRRAAVCLAAIAASLYLRFKNRLKCYARIPRAILLLLSVLAVFL
jgi:hypothetical protein